MNRINFGLSVIFLAAIAFIGYLWVSGPKDGDTEDNGPQTDTLVTAEAETEAASTDEDMAADEDALENYTPEIGLVDNASLHTNQAGIQIIKDYEGLRLEAYQTDDGWLIGYGHIKGVEPGQKISEADAEALLLDDLRLYENEVKAAVTVPMNENEFSALVSLTYNIGITALWSSTTLEELNSGNRAAAADGFLLWNKMAQDGQLVQNMSLTDRREEERALFLTPVDPAADDSDVPTEEDPANEEG